MATTRTRPVGPAEWSPSPEALSLVGAVADVLRRYQDHLPVSLRQTFYALVSAGVLPKDERAYARLGEVVNRARRAGLLAFHSIRDDGVTAREPHFYAGPDDFHDRMLDEARGYRVDRQAGQVIYIEVWTEAGGTVPQIANAVAEYGVPVYSAGGFLSLTAIHDAAERAASRDVPTLAIQIGDLDPSGVSIFDRLSRDVTAFAFDNGGKFAAARLALTQWQVEDMGIETAPPKRTDSRAKRWEGETAQLEAIPPDVLTHMVVEAIEASTDAGIRDEVLKREADERSALIARLDEEVTK